MDNEMPKTIDYTVHESIMARMERVNKRWFIAWLITFILLCCCVGGFIWYESSYEDVVVTQENSDGVNNYVGNDGSIYNYPETDSDQGNLEGN